MKAKIYMGARILLALIYIIFGLNGFFQFIPMPPPPEAAASFGGALMATGYFFPLLKVTEIVCSILILVNYAAPLALVILAPITIQILFFHLFLTPGFSFLLMPLVMVIAHVLAALGYWDKFKPLFAKN